MFNQRNTVVLILVMALFFLMSTDAGAQCAMCKAVAENAQDESGYGLTNGLNSGILFIMAIPYILLGTLLFVFFRKQISGFWRSFNQIH